MVGVAVLKISVQSISASLLWVYMMNVLFLKAEEQEIYNTLSDELKNGWEVRMEEVDFADEPRKRLMRLYLLHLHDSKVMQFVEEAKKVNDPEKIATMMQDMDIADIDDGDLAELFFALGPNVLDGIIRYSLREAQTDDDIEGVVAVATIRHTLLESLTPAT